MIVNERNDLGDRSLGNTPLGVSPRLPALPKGRDRIVLHIFPDALVSKTGFRA